MIIKIEKILIFDRPKYLRYIFIKILDNNE